MLLLADEDNDDVIESFWQIIFSVLHSFTFYCLDSEMFFFYTFSFTCYGRFAYVLYMVLQNCIKVDISSYIAMDGCVSNTEI